MRLIRSLLAMKVHRRIAGIIRSRRVLAVLALNSDSFDCASGSLAD
jgi:hypothetical protein